jgi:S-adenosylmethionine:tRNA ribosyltransferase-isomerase
MEHKLNLSDYDFELPPELIAQQPLPNRDESRLLVIDRKTGLLQHRIFKEIPDYFGPEDVLVLNDTRVIPARAWAHPESQPDKQVEFLFVRELNPALWEVLCRPAKRVQPGEVFIFDKELKGQVREKGPLGHRVLEFNTEKVREKLKEIGAPPLPPYIKRKKDDPRLKTLDRERYQTVFAKKEGSIAAPTAGLHFTPATLEEIRKKGTTICYVTLNVGEATFQPVRVEKVTEHRMLPENYYLSEETAEILNRARAEGKKITAVGTTVVRTLESAFAQGQVRSGQGATSLFIYPGYTFKVVDRLLTNFHLPRSTLLMLVSAFAGYDLIRNAYQVAVKEKYRFFSYGDCMLIL